MPCPPLKPRYPKYSDYAGQTVEQIFGSGLNNAVVKQAETFATRWRSAIATVPIRWSRCRPQRRLLGVRHPCGRFRSRRKDRPPAAGNFSGVQPEIGGMMASYG